MREIGDQPKARKLAEEAYKSSSDQQERQAAASMRTLTSTNLDDRIKWIRRCDQSQSYVKAALSEALGNQAVRAKNDEKATKHFREAIAEYGRQEKSATSLNNGALAYLSLFGVSRDSSDFQQAVAMLENAVRLQPDDSILLGNTASTILRGALTDVIGDSLDLKLIGQSGSISMLGYLYDSESQRKSWADRVTQHQGVRKSLEMNSKVLILAPKNVNAYLATYSVHSFSRDLQ